MVCRAKQKVTAVLLEIWSQIGSPNREVFLSSHFPGYCLECEWPAKHSFSLSTHLWLPIQVVVHYISVFQIF